MPRDAKKANVCTRLYHRLWPTNTNAQFGNEQKRFQTFAARASAAAERSHGPMSGPLSQRPSSGEGTHANAYLHEAFAFKGLQKPFVFHYKLLFPKPFKNKAFPALRWGLRISTSNQCKCNILTPGELTIRGRDASAVKPLKILMVFDRFRDVCETLEGWLFLCPHSNTNLRPMTLTSTPDEMFPKRTPL